MKSVLPLLLIGGVMIRMEGNKTKIIAVNGDNGPERTGDTYGIEGVAFPGFHVPDLLQVEPRGSSNLIKIHLVHGPKGLDQGVKIILLQLEKIFLEIRKIQVKSQDFSPEQRGRFLTVYYSLPSDRRLLTGPEKLCL